MRGKHPAGPEFVDRLDGSEKARLRARVILQLIAGAIRVPEACKRLGIKPARLDQLRLEGLQALVTAMKEKQVGRPAHVPSPAEVENEELRARIARVEAERDAALVRAELAVALPRVGAASKKNDNAAPVPGETAAPRSSSPSHEEIVNHLKKLMPNQPVAEGPPSRGFAGQRADRENKQVVRRHVVDAAQRLVEQGWTWADTARWFGMPTRTLGAWRLDDATNPLRAVPLGRPAYIAPPSERDVVIHRIDELGPGVGLPTLRPEFPQLPRAELEDILTRYRREWRQRNRQVLNELHWSAPGSVWAIDHHGPRAQAIDGRYHYLFAVRDLASGQVLLWLPVTDATAPIVVGALEALFRVHGAPLVLKSDNGSAFIAARLRTLCQKFGVKNLYSPPRTPSYNGSIEATIGSLKIRTERHAAQDGRPGCWTSTDAEAARREANAHARPHGPHGPSPDQAWQARTPIAPAQRDRFFDTAIRRFENLASAQRSPEDDAQGSPKRDAQRRAMDREAISQSLVELGYLSITRGRSRLPVCKKKVAETR